ncbi:hypothetical protein ABPG72_008530 [Tetrahymena utriculariae]
MNSILVDFGEELKQIERQISCDLVSCSSSFEVITQRPGSNLDFQLPRIQIGDIINLKEMLQDALNELICPICKEVIHNPKACINCETNFCGYCIQKLTQKSSSNCPRCADQGQQAYYNSRIGFIQKQQACTYQIDRSQYSDQNSQNSTQLNQNSLSLLLMQSYTQYQRKNRSSQSRYVSPQKMLKWLMRRNDLRGNQTRSQLSL